MIEAAWLWLRHQPKSALSLWFKNRVKGDRGRHRRVAIVALARKLLIAFWRFATVGEIPEGAELKIAEDSQLQEHESAGLGQPRWIRQGEPRLCLAGTRR